MQERIDYIDRDELLRQMWILLDERERQLYENGELDSVRKKHMEEDYDWMHKVVLDSDSVDARPVVRGKWINNRAGDLSPVRDDYVCSECGNKAPRVFGSRIRTNFCSYCGADMRRENNGRTTI